MQTLFDILRLHTKKRKNQLAVCCDKQKITYGQLYNATLFCGNKLRKMLGKKRNIGIYINKSIEYVIAYFSISYVGGTIVPINTKMPAEKINAFLKSYDVDVVITSDLLQKAFEDNLLLDKIKTFNLHSWEHLIDEISIVEGMVVPPVWRYDEESVAILIQTSGTTSKGKMVMLTNKNLLSNANMIIQDLGITNKDITLIVLPIYLSCNTSQFLSHLLAGASVVLYDGIFDAQKVWNLVDECSISNFHIVPPMLYLLHRSIHQVKTTLETLRFICYSGGPSNYSIVLEFQKCMQGVSLIETYGMTEAGPRISSIFPNEKVQHPSSVGKPMNGVDVRIMDSSGNFWHSGEGELVVKSDSVMVGYYGEMTETSKVLRDGWLRTGDLCFLDEFGYIHLKGRVKAIINCGGNKFSPEFVESVLLQFPGVKEAFVYPQKHSVLGEVAEAQIVVESKIKAKEFVCKLLQYCEKEMDQYQIPKKIHIVSFINKNESGKNIRYGYGSDCNNR